MFSKTRILLSVGAVGVYSLLQKTHEIVSPLVSGPMAAQQLSDSNAAYVGTQVTSRLFNGAGTGLLGFALLVAVLAAIWYQPAKRMLTTVKEGM
jgi:hypothetical protein